MYQSEDLIKNLKALKLTPQEIKILIHIFHNKKYLSISEVARYLDISYQSASKSLRKLRDRHFVKEVDFMWKEYKLGDLDRACRKDLNVRRKNWQAVLDYLHEPG